MEWTPDPGPVGLPRGGGPELDPEAVAALGGPADAELERQLLRSASRRRPASRALTVVATAEHILYAVVMVGAALAVILLDIGLWRWAF